jgi:hypothetical protein
MTRVKPYIRPTQKYVQEHKDQFVNLNEINNHLNVPSNPHNNNYYYYNNSNNNNNYVSATANISLNQLNINNHNHHQLHNVANSESQHALGQNKNTLAMKRSSDHLPGGKSNRYPPFFLQ